MCLFIFKIQGYHKTPYKGTKEIKKYKRKVTKETLNGLVIEQVFSSKILFNYKKFWTQTPIRKRCYIFD